MTTKIQDLFKIVWTLSVMSYLVTDVLLMLDSRMDIH